MEVNCTTCFSGFGVFLGSFQLWLIVAILSSILFLSLCWNVLCCLPHCGAGRSRKFLPRFRKSMKLTEMEDNPIYGNINFTQARVEYMENSSSANGQQQSNTSVQEWLDGTEGTGETEKHNPHSFVQEGPNKQDCYANLKLKAPKPSSGRSSPQIQYSDVMTLPRAKANPDPSWKEGDDLSHLADDVSSQNSDLYASVDSQRNKALIQEKDYANRM